eukprot:2222230-Prorocentrum_lima.AAC.1
MPFNLLPAFLKTGVLLPSCPKHGDSAYTVRNGKDHEIVRGVHVWDTAKTHRTSEHRPLLIFLEDNFWYSSVTKVRA